MKQIGIIGAGAGGLCALKHCLSLKGAISVVAWEIQAEIGGTWVFNPKTGKDEFGLPIHSSMYNSLKTNLPKEIMGYPGFPFPPREESYIRHLHVLDYLKSYADEFDLNKHIMFRHKVESVEPETSSKSDECRWKVLVKNILDGTLSWGTYDYLFVCNGHVSVPNVPHIRNIKRFSGKVTHSHDYREPSSFSTDSVAVLGARSSGLDISLEISSVAKQVYLCHNLSSPIVSTLPANISNRRGIKEATEDGFILADDSFIQADQLLFCTGYKYSHPFLEPSCGITVGEGFVKPLYKHLVNAQNPSMFFIGMGLIILPFPFYDIQVRYCLQVINGLLKLQHKEELLKESNVLFEELSARGELRHLHLMGDKQWKYLEDLSQEAKISPLDKYIELIYTDNSDRRKTKLTSYQRNCYRITSPDSFVIDCRE